MQAFGFKVDGKTKMTKELSEKGRGGNFYKHFLREVIGSQLSSKSALFPRPVNFDAHLEQSRYFYIFVVVQQP